MRRLLIALTIALGLAPLAALGQVFPGTTANTIYSNNSTGVFGLRNIITGQNYNATFTNSDEAYGYSFRNSTTTGLAIYQTAIFPGVDYQDGVQSVMVIPSGSTVEHGTGFAAYIKNDAAENGVGFFSAGIGTVQDSRVWVANGVLMDNSTRATHARTGQHLLGFDFNANVMGTATTVQGFICGGNSLAQPTNATCFVVNELSNGNKWTGGLTTSNGAVAEFGIVLGAVDSSGASVASQKFLQRYFDSGSTERTMTMQASDGALSVTNSQTSIALSIGGAGSSLGSIRLHGSTSGTVTVTPQAAAGTYNFNLPTSAGSSGQPLLSAGGGASPMTFGTLGVGAGGTGLTSGTSGGILYYSASNTIASSAALASNGVVKGGGAGGAPTTTNSCSIDANQSLNCASSTSFNPAFNITNTTNDANYPNLRFIHGRGSSVGLLQADDAMGALVFAGGNGTGQDNCASIVAYVDGTPGASNDMPARMVFSTCADGSATQTEAMRITRKQHIAFSGTAPTLTAGCNGAGSSVSGTNIAGTVTGQTAAATTCTLTFANSGFAAAPHCVVSGQNSPLTGAFTPSTTTIIVNFASTASYKWSYVCFGI